MIVVAVGRANVIRTGGFMAWFAIPPAFLSFHR